MEAERLEHEVRVRLCDVRVARVARAPGPKARKVEEGGCKRVVEGEGPLGAQGVPLTPGRSLAVDRAFLPLGAPVWLDTTDPLTDGEPLRRLLITQDTGSAIKGPVRGDGFWGFGDTAARRAGLMKQEGRYYILLPKAAERIVDGVRTMLFTEFVVAPLARTARRSREGGICTLPARWALGF